MRKRISNYSESDKDFKGTIVNRTCQQLNTFSVPFKPVSFWVSTEFIFVKKLIGIQSVLQIF